MPKLNQWTLMRVEHPDYPNDSYLKGIISEPDPEGKFKTGDAVRTSRLKDLDLVAMTAITHKGTLYHLGQPNPEWVKWLKTAEYKSGPQTAMILAAAERYGDGN